MELSPLDKNIENLTKQILSETDENKSKDLIHLFNLNQSKKNVLRSNKYSDMLELVIKQMMERITKTPDNFSNDDLLNRTKYLLDPEYLICTIKSTHDAIHYGDENLLMKDPIERRQNDTCPWRK